MEARVKSNGFVDDFEVAVEMRDLAAQLGQASPERDRVNLLGLKKPIQRGFDERRFCQLTMLGHRRQSCGRAFREIDANPGFHCVGSPK
jgi:hypothetical protein